VNIHADAVPEAVAELLAVARRLDRDACERVQLARA
jgi:hypothetical protein